VQPRALLVDGHAIPYRDFYGALRRAYGDSWREVADRLAGIRPLLELDVVHEGEKKKVRRCEKKHVDHLFPLVDGVLWVAVPAWAEIEDPSGVTERPYWLYVSEGGEALWLDGFVEKFPSLRLRHVMECVPHPDLDYDIDLVLRWCAVRRNRRELEERGVDIGPFGDALRTAFEAVRALVERLVEFQNDYEYDIVALWALGTYFHSFFPAYPYLWFHGPRGSGKTRALNVLYHICFNAHFVVDPSEASMFRLAELLHATLLIDELEWEVPQVRRAFEALLRAGYKKHISVTRAWGEGVRKYSVYGPKAIASIRNLDRVLADRAIEVRMRRALRALGPALLDVMEEEFRVARTWCLLAVLASWRAVLEAYGEVERELAGWVRGRVAELWLPLLALAKCIDQELYERLLLALDEKSLERKLEDYDDLGVAILLALDDILDGKEEVKLSIYELTQEVLKYLDEPVDERGLISLCQRVGRKVKEMGLGRNLPPRRGRRMRLFRRDEVKDYLVRWELDGNGDGDMGRLLFRVKLMIRQGYTREEIRNHLLAQGFDERLVTRVINKV